MDAARDPVGGPVSTVVPVTEASQVGEARRAATLLGAQAGLGETAIGTLALLATETATNLARHARDGMLVLRPVHAADAPAGGAYGGGAPAAERRGVELLALDHGPGIADLGRAIADGYSTGGTAGRGLGAMRRMAHDFDLYSLPERGTAIVMRVWAGGGSGRPAVPPGVVCVPVRGEQACGDGWTVITAGGYTVVAVVDGLGHGPDAARAADAAMAVVRAHAGATPAEIVRAAHAALRPTRGAALAVARLEPGRGQLRFAGVGNVSASVATMDGTRSMASHNGIVGHEMRTVHEFTHDWPAGGSLLMHSDGLQSRWRLDAYPGLLVRDPAIVAGVLFRDFARGRDDATALVVRAADLADHAPPGG